MIIIYKLEYVNNESQYVEKGRWDGKFISGFKNYPEMTKEEIIKDFNRGYYRTSEI